MLIIDDFCLHNYTQPSKNIIAQTQSSKQTWERTNFVPQLTGTLIEKRLMTNSYKKPSEHLDLLITNLEFKLVLKLEDETDSIITVYFDSKLLLYPFCILSGMRVTVFNLIQRSENTYKSSSILRPSFHQDFNLLLFDQIETKLKHQYQEIKLKKNLYDQLQEFRSIYSNFYINMSKKSREIGLRLGLLFKDNQPIRIMAQILKIYDLVLCLRCKSCELLVNSCDCKERNSVKKYDMDIYKDYLGKSIIIIS